MRRFLSLCLCLFLLSACGRVSIQEQQAYVFGTRVEVMVVGDDPELARQAIASVLREFDRLHRTYHAWQESELTALNSAIFAGRPQQVSDELAKLILESQELSKNGQYLFDPGIGRLIKAWGFHAEEFKAQLPPPTDLQQLIAAHPSIQELSLTGNSVSSRNQEVALDFGGYLKGVALDRAASILRQQGIHNALINIGGNVMALGSKEGLPWRVGIQHPRQSGPLATVELADGEAIGTSGDYQRYFELDGKRYPHLLDPRTGYPTSHTQAVTVLIPAGKRAGTLSDASSKPIYIAGPKAWRTLAQQQQLTWVLRIDQNGKVQVTEAFAKRLKFVGNGDPIEIIP
ncbi:MAG: FAD:protein FMN transferase [Rhodocyclaceae bacterium]|nr:FAD:protein FMN transferase [Rhodocyclaceae bacterium]